MPGRNDPERPNRWFLGDAGQAELVAAARAKRYRVEPPEHAAFLAENRHPFLRLECG